MLTISTRRQSGIVSHINIPELFSALVPGQPRFWKYRVQRPFWQMVDVIWKPEACWRWLGLINAQGYGRAVMAGETFKAHRIAYVLAYEVDIDPDLTIDHLCRNRGCCRPDHLEVVTLRDNIFRGAGVSAINKWKTHCRHGHPFDAKNTRFRREGKRARACRACGRTREAARRDAALQGVS